MSFTISKRFNFSASHRLKGLAEDHPCSRLHGHNYTIIFTFQSAALNEIGFVIDYRALGDIKHFIDSTIDHYHLNDLFDFNPTAENIAKWFFEGYKAKYPQLKSVTVKETEKTSAIYEP